MLDLNELDNIVFSLLFASDEPLSARRIAAVVNDTNAAEVRDSLFRINTELQNGNLCIKLENIAGGYQLTTKPEFARYIAGLYTGKRKHRLSRAGMETLAIIAYKQPVTRAAIEQVRGVNCGGVLSTLMERSLIKITGKDKVLGAPFLYGTTSEFLEYLGLNNLKDLPTIEELESVLETKEKEGEEDEHDEPATGEVLSARPLEKPFEQASEKSGVESSGPLLEDQTAQNPFDEKSKKPQSDAES